MNKNLADLTKSSAFCKMEVLHYRHITQMPPFILRSCRLMGFHQYNYVKRGHLRRVVKEAFWPANERTYTVRSSLVMVVDGVVVGWTVLYKDKYCSYVGVWVKHAHRGLGYGKILSTHAFNRWFKYGPAVFNSVEGIWQALARERNLGYHLRNY